MPTQDLDQIKTRCLKVLKDQSIILDLTQYKSQTVLKLIPMLFDLNLYNQNLRALSLQNQELDLPMLISELN